tara:strand:+ start:10803 stop:12200 length:1398 start_codon:yes stop_codon:yes gene_type:complete
MHIKHFAIAIIAYVSFWGVVYAAKDTYDSAILDNALSGGETTVFNYSRDAFAKPAANLPTKKLRDFTFGNKMFNTRWVTAPASVTSLDGLGPTFNRKSCAACHFKDGRGKPPSSPDEPMMSMLVRLSVPGNAADGGPLGHPVYGGQLNDRAVHGVPAEGMAQIFYEDIKGQYPDGTPYSLRKPNYKFIEMAYGPLGDDIMFSPRVAPALHGAGLLEAIPEDTIMAWADPNDADADGISGRPNMVWDPINNTKALGRFGWKANVSSLRLQDAGAAVGDMGVTTSVFPEQNCQNAQTECINAPHGGAPEMSDTQLDKMTFYVSTLAVPARRSIDDPQVLAGARAFEQARCIQCHKPKAMTGEHAVDALSNQLIQPFTDMLLHDMGEGLADHRPDYEATGTEWRTAPLWGIGLVKIVNKHTNFLHDGRARNIEEAILWHGGEAEASQEAFKAMNKEKRDALITFLNSL